MFEGDQPLVETIHEEALETAQEQEMVALETMNAVVTSEEIRVINGGKHSAPSFIVEIKIRDCPGTYVRARLAREDEYDNQ